MERPNGTFFLSARPRDSRNACNCYIPSEPRAVPTFGVISRLTHETGTQNGTRNRSVALLW
jgi:hypothetical protein